MPSKPTRRERSAAEQGLARRLQAAEGRVAELEAALRQDVAALGEIVECGDKTLLGGDFDELERVAPNRNTFSGGQAARLAHEIGASKAFGQCADIARAALAANKGALGDG